MSPTIDRVTVLGAGIMGSGIAQSLLRQGIPTTVWNRTPGKTTELEALGAVATTTLDQAVANADIIFIVLFDGASVLRVLEQAAKDANPEAIWVQTATVGEEASRAIQEFAAEHDLQLVETMMMGSKLQAEQGELILLGAGAPALFERIKPATDAIAKKLVYCGTEVGDGTVVKLACNSWVATITAGAAQAIALVSANGLDPQLFLDSIAGATSDSPYAHIKGEKIMNNDFAAQFAIEAVCKDLSLIEAAASSAQINTSIIGSVRTAYDQTNAAGHGSEDLSAVYTTLRNK